MKGAEASYVIPLRKVYRFPKTKRARRAVQEVRNFSKRHGKADTVIVTEEVNENIWKNSYNIPRAIEVIIRKEGENKVVVYWKGGEQLEQIKRKEVEDAKKKREEAKKKREEEKKGKEEESKEEQEQKKKLEDKRKRELSAEKAAIKRKTSRK